MSFQYTNAFVAIATVNLEKLVDFYLKFLSQNPTNYIPNVYAEFELSSLKLGIFQPKLSHTSEFNDSFRSYMSLCLEVNDLESVMYHLEKLGHPPFGEIINTSHGREIYAYDIDGNRIILHQSHKTG
ncbi:VOC family protein [Plectonema cf. radiosum LEGE 06105]|uniref:VOC family protein n=1 Tax=Plectonema cf. radiosum LEGE 06105 TaxID=945769 RepID=A0A8J7JT34_9CYAN|nr:VOC family protein [Plectonema radiosum]MBE9213254.1 VOC family protein [Plectonema cf. radiosum LEGE 06105]